MGWMLGAACEYTPQNATGLHAHISCVRTESSLFIISLKTLCRGLSSHAMSLNWEDVVVLTATTGWGAATGGKQHPSVITLSTIHSLHEAIHAM